MAGATKMKEDENVLLWQVSVQLTQLCDVTGVASSGEECEHRAANPWCPSRSAEQNKNLNKS